MLKEGSAVCHCVVCSECVKRGRTGGGCRGVLCRVYCDVDRTGKTNVGTFDESTKIPNT